MKGQGFDVFLQAQSEAVIVAEHALVTAPSIFVILNTTTEENLLATWTKQAWAVQSIPLYYQTSMESILKYSPWLLEVDVKQLTAVSEWVASQTDLSWGWCYTSTQAWRAQVEHWRRYLRVIIEGKLSALRFHDPRVIELWLEQAPDTLWQNLLATALQFYLPSGITRLNNDKRRVVNSQFPWPLPTAYSEAWYHSPFGINVRASNLDLQLWERSPSQASALCQTHGDLVLALATWLQQRINNGESIMNINLDMAFNALTQQQRGRLS